MHELHRQITGFRLANNPKRGTRMRISRRRSLAVCALAVVMAAGGLSAAVVGSGVASASISSSWTPTVVPLPASPGTGGYGLRSVSCSDALDCTAVTQGVDGQGAYLTETAGVWGVETSLPIADGTSVMKGISCTDAVDCTAVGSASITQGTEPIVATETEGIWASVARVDTSGIGGQGNFNAVSCTSATECTAVGSNSAGATTYATESAGTWGPMTELGTAGWWSDAGFNAVSCTAVGDCTAVGADGMMAATTATETAGSWATPTSVSTPNATLLNGVSCTPTSGQAHLHDCTAVGQDEGNSDAVVVSSIAGVWGTGVALSGASNGGLSSVSCADASDCTAVGASGYNQHVAITETAGTWGSASQIGADYSYGSSLQSVSCPDAADCTAVGSDQTGDSYVTEVSGSWGTPVAAVVMRPSSGLFRSVSCTDPVDCTAIGNETQGEAFASTEVAGVWGAPVIIAVPVGTVLFLLGISCTSSGNCTAVGFDTPGLPIEVTEVAGSWGTPVELSSSAGLLASVSCTSSQDCTAVGTDFSTLQPVIDTEVGGTWGALRTLASPSQGFFNEISCSDASDCTAVGTVGGPVGPGLVATETGGTWGAFASLSDTGSLNSVSCVGPGSCTAVGTDSSGHPAYAKESGGAWQPAMAVSSSPGVLLSVSCVSASFCTGIGSAPTSTDVGPGAPAPLTVTEIAGTWSQPTSPLMTDVLNSVSCPTAAHCITVGKNHGQPVEGDLFGSPTMIWATPAVITVGTPLSSVQLDATVVDGAGTPVPGTIDYSANGVDPVAVGSLLGLGSHYLVARFTPTNAATYATVSTHVELTVKMLPVVRWGTLKPITYGTALGAAQLNAGASVAGAFSYSPAPGTILTGGTHTLTATFTPSDSTNYTTTSVATTEKVTAGVSATALTLGTATVTVGSETAATFTVTVHGPNLAPGVGTVAIKAGSKLACTITLTGSGTGSCALTSSQLKAGTYSVKAVLAPNSSLKGSTSAASTLLVH